MISKKIPILGINQDDTFALVDTKEYLNALNLRFTTSESGKVGQLSTIEGNVLKNTTLNVSGTEVPFVLPAGDNSIIGAYEDTPNKRMFFFNRNSNGNHGIYCYDSVLDIVYTVLLSSQVEDGLGFSSLIHSVSMIDTLIYWTDGVNPQRRINVEAGIKTNHPTYTTSYSSYATLFVGAITAGTSYTNGVYTNVTLTGGTGSGAKATIVVSGNAVTSVTITYGGSGYTVGDSLTTANTNIGGTGSGFSFLVSDVKINQSVINLIRNQPAFPLTVAKLEQTSPAYPNNFIAGEAVQFMYRFVYRDYEVSTFSPISDLCNYNTPSQTFNAIDVTIPLTQKIDQDVIKIEIAVRYVLGGSVSIFKTITSGFQSHNNGTAITTRFYNDSVGIAVDSASSVKPFDSVPISSGTLEIAKNRLFLGDNSDGYESPSSTSLATTTVTDNGAALVGKWFKVSYGGNDKYIIYINGVEQSKVGYYYIPSPTLPLPTTYDFNSIPINYSLYPTGNYLTSDQLTVWDKLYGLNYWPSTGSFAYQKDVTITNGPAVLSLDGKTIFKSDSSYRLGVVFYDYAGRKCGVVTNDTLKMVTPDRTYSSPAFTTTINWTLSNTSSLTEIPSWAHYYSVVVTKGLRASSFIQMKVAGAGLKYVTKSNTGEYNLETTYTADRYGIAIEAKSLFAFGLGYAYQAGDIVKLYNSSTSTIYRLKVKDTFGEYIVADLIDMSSLTNVIYEVYSPYVESSNEPYYEVGETYSILNPGTVTRTYSTTVGNIDGDVSSVKRNIGSTDFLFEAMSPNDIYWQNWNRNIGRPNIVLDSKNAQKKTSVYYSNVVILGSQTNGLSSFEALSQTQLPYELTRIRKLQLVSKVGAEGTVMLAVGEQETASIYLGEAQIFDNSGNSFLATTSGVIGNVNILRGSYGTINPESIFKWKGNVVWFDANKGAWVRYDTNGLFPISQNKMAKYFRKVGQDVLAHISDPTEFNLSNPGVEFRVLGGIDPYHEEYLSSIPRMTIHPENAVLEDMELQTNTYAFATLPPTIDLIPNALSFSYSGSGPSTKKSVSFVGTRLEENGNITVSGNADFEMSLTGNTGTFTSGTLSFPYTGTEANGTFWVRFKSGKSDGTYTATRAVAGGGASANLYLEGVKIPTTGFSVTPASMSFLYVFGAGPSASQAASYTGTGLTSGGTFIISGTTDFEVSLSSGSGFTGSISIPYTGTSASGTFYIRLKAGRAVASYGAQNVTMSNGTTSDTVSCTGTVTAAATPTLSVTPSSLSFTYVEGSGPSASQSVSYSGSALTDPGTIDITAPSNFEISSDNSTFGASLSIGYTGTAPTGTFYVRMKSGLSAGSYGPQTVSLSGGGASTSLSCFGTVTSVASPPVLTATPSTLSGFTYEEGSGPSATQTFVVSGSNLTPASGNVTITPPTHYEVSVTSGTSGFSSSPLTLAYTGSGTFAQNTVWVRLKAGFNNGTYNSETISLSGGGASATVTCNGVVTAVDTSISFYLTPKKKPVGSKYEVRWYLSSSAGSETPPAVAHPFYIDLKYSVYGTGIDGGISSPLSVSSLELSNTASNVAQGTLATNWFGSIYPIEVRLREVSGSYGPYTVVINGSNSAVTNPVTFTVGTQAYKINIFNVVL
jgi:hypothetical protein